MEASFTPTSRASSAGVVEHDVRRPITPRLSELQPHLTLVGQVEPILHHGRTQRISTHALEPIPLPGRYDEARMQIEAVRPRVTASGDCFEEIVGVIHKATQAATYTGQ